MPKVSVILPVYNVGLYIEKCIKSLLSQTLKDIEIIFVDDCSPDDSVEIIKKYNDPRIKLIQHSVNKYTAEARNTGVKTATGEYIAFVDPDDYIDFDYLEKLYTLAKNTNADIAKGAFRNIPSDKIINTNHLIKLNKYRFNSSLWSAIYKRTLFDNPDVKFYVDVMVCHFLLVHYANKIVTCDDTFYNYVKHDSSCVNSEFTQEKWRKLNVRGANLIHHFINKYDLNINDYCLILRKSILKLYLYGYNKMSEYDRTICKAELNRYLDDVFVKAKHKNRKFLEEYEEVRKKYG